MIKLQVLLIISLLLLSSAFLAAEPFPSIAMFEWTMDDAAETGFREGVLKSYADARFYVYNAAEDPLLLERMLDVASQRQHDLYYVSGTAAVQLIMGREKKRPLVFTMVPDPLTEGMVASWDSSENNLTGISNHVPILNQLKTLKRILDFHRLGVLYNPSNPDSLGQVGELERLQPFLGFAMRRIPITIPAQAQSLQLPPDLDAVFLTQDPLIERLGHTILTQVNAAGLPSLAADLNLVTRKGALLGLVPDEYRIGRLAALSAVRILDGTPPTSIPSRSLDFFMVVLNMQTARQLEVQVPFSLLVIADTIVR